MEDPNKVDFDKISKDFEYELKDNVAWSLGTQVWHEYNKTYKLTIMALNELKTLYLEIGPDNFIPIVKNALCSTREPGTITDLFCTIPDTALLNEYYKMLLEFNYKFLIDNIEKIPLHSLIKYLSYSVGSSSMRKEFIDAIKLDINSPQRYIDEFKKDYDKLWYDGYEKCDDMLALATGYAKNGKYREAKKIYRELLKGESKENIDVIKYRYILCCLANDDYIDYIIETSRKLKELKDSFKDYDFLTKLILHVTNYDVDNFTELLKTRGTLDEFEIPILSKIKQSIMNN